MPFIPPQSPGTAFACGQKVDEMSSMICPGRCPRRHHHVSQEKAPMTQERSEALPSQGPPPAPTQSEGILKRHCQEPGQVPWEEGVPGQHLVPCPMRRKVGRWASPTQAVTCLRATQEVEG